jgi:hypothetical protein
MVWYGMSLQAVFIVAGSILFGSGLCTWGVGLSMGSVKWKIMWPYIVHTWWCHTLQNKQCTYYITLWRVCVTVVAVDKVISVTYSECAPVHLIISIQCACAFLYCHLWPVWPYYISLHYIISGTVFERKKKKLLNINVRFDFFYYYSHQHLSFQQELSEILS